MSSEIAVQLTGVTKQYRSKSTVVEPLHQVDLTIRRGEWVALCGPSGGGKTTLLNLMGGIARPSGGAIRLFDKDITRLPDSFLTQLRREKIGFVFQQYHLINGFTVAENVTMSLVPTAVSYPVMNQRAREVITRFGLAHRIDFPVAELSGGEQQRVALARALINDPELILADEPTSNIDELSSQAVVDLLVELKKQGKTIVLATHDPKLLSNPLLDGVYTVKEGAIRHKKVNESAITGGAFSGEV